MVDQRQHVRDRSRNVGGDVAGRSCLMKIGDDGVAVGDLERPDPACGNVDAKIVAGQFGVAAQEAGQMGKALDVIRFRLPKAGTSPTRRRPAVPAARTHQCHGKWVSKTSGPIEPAKMFASIQLRAPSAIPSGQYLTMSRTASAAGLAVERERRAIGRRPV